MLLAWSTSVVSVLPCVQAMIRIASLRSCRTLVAASVRVATTIKITAAKAGTCVTPSLSRPLTTSNEVLEEQDIKWRFLADDRTQDMVVRVKHGLAQTTNFTLHSKAPVTPDLMEEALAILYDKFVCLRLCLRPRDGQLWFADMPRPKLDFQVVSGTDFEEEHAAIRRSPFNLYEGPLWKAWFMPSPADAPCAFPEMKEAFPHQCHLLLSFHHAAIDGAVVMTATEVLLRIIDSLLEGATIDTRPIGELRDGMEIREVEDRIRADLESDAKMLLEAVRKQSMNKRLPVLVEAYGMPNEANNTTNHLQPVLLDTQLMEQLAAKCHSIGATLNSCFTAVCNVSIIEMALEAGFERDVYNVISKHPVDCRRLMKDSKSLILGFHAIPVTQCTATPRNARKHFWQYVKHMDTSLRSKLQGNQMCEERVLDSLMRPDGFPFEAMYGGRPVPNSDYIFGNIYHPKFSKNQGIGKNVQITWVGNYMDFHNEKNMFGQALFSTRGQARYQLSYSTAAMSRKLASRCFEKNVATLHDVSRMAN